MFLKAQHIITVIIMFCCAFFSKAQQNLVLNGGFEDTIFCNPGISTINQLKYWYNPTMNSSFVRSYCHTVSFGPRTGSVCAGGYTYYTFGLPTEQYNYYANKFKDTLLPNKEYCFKMYLKLNKQFRNGSNNLGVFIENSVISYTTTSFLVPAIPVATLTTTVIDTSYQAFTFTYNSVGGETDFMIGGYLPYNNANYPLSFPNAQSNSSFFIYDDFSLVPTDIDLGNDISICTESDSLLIGEPNWVETNYKWFANGMLIDTLHGQIKIKPNSNTTYIIQKQTTCTTTTDTLLVTYTGSCPVLPIDLTEAVIPNVFTPNGDDVNEYWRITLPTGAKLIELEVHNRWGNIVFESEGTIKPWFGRTSSGEPCSEGIYFYVLKYIDAKGDEQKKNGYISLFR